MIARVRDWLNANRPAGTPPLPGAEALADDYRAFQLVAPAVIAEFRLSKLDGMNHPDFMYTTERALEFISRGR